MACHSFCIPATADELLHEQSDWRDDLELHRDNARDDIDGVMRILNDDVTMIVEPRNFSTLFWAIREFTDLPRDTRRDISIGLSTALKLSTSSLAAADASEAPECNMESMKMYSFLLAEAARPLSDTVEKAQNQKPKAGGHKGMDASAESLQAWEQLLNAANAITQVDLRSYYRSEADVQGIALCLFDVARKALALPCVARKDNTAQIIAIMQACAGTWGAIDQVAPELVTMLASAEHVRPILVELVQECVEAGTLALPQRMLSDILERSPLQYSDLAKRASGGVSHIAAFLTSIAEQCPALVEKQLALFIPQLAGPHQLRSAVVRAVSRTITWQQTLAAANDSADRVRTRRATAADMLDILLQRALLDSSAYTRQAAMQEWERLIEQRCVPMSHWDLVARCLRHKVSDKSMLVRRWAMKGLESMLFQNPFGPNLVLEFWKRLLDEWEAVLEARAPAEDKDASSEPPGEESKENTATQTPASSRASPPAPLTAQSPLPTPAMTPHHTPAATAGAPLATASAHDPHTMPFETLRLQVANFKTAVNFVLELHAALPALESLLALSTDTDVAGAISLLKLLSKFSIEEAGEGLHRMLALVFTTDVKIRAVVLDAFQDLYIGDVRPFFACHESPAVIATKLTALMASRHGTLGTAAAVQRCFALLLKDPADPFSCAHNVANCLLQLCRQRLLTLAAGRSSRSANAFTLGPASDALQEAQAAMQVLAMLAAERPMLLAGTAKQILASAFPHRSKLDLGLELLQKWALDAVVAMARDVSTAPEVKTEDTLKLVVDILTRSEAKPERHMLIQSAVRLLYAACSDPSQVVMPLLATSARSLLAMPLSLPPEERASLATAAAGDAALDAHTDNRRVSATKSSIQLSDRMDTPSPTQLAAPAPRELDASATPTIPTPASLLEDAASPGHGAPQSTQRVAERRSLDGTPTSEQLAACATPVASTPPAMCADSAQPLGCAATLHVDPTQPQCTGAPHQLQPMQLQDVPRHAQHVHLARESLNAADARVAAFFQLLGMVVIEHLCLLEQVVGHARKRADNGGGAGKGSDDAGLAGVTGGAAADDFEERLHEEFVQQLEPMIVLTRTFCGSETLLQASSTLQSAALLALCKLMLVSETLCSECLQLVFSLLAKRVVDACVRRTVSVALSDLMLRWPNTMAPFTAQLYAPLNDPDAQVRINAMMIINHLMLNEMMKAKGQISKVCLCFHDPEPQVRVLAVQLFEELSKKSIGNHNPIFAFMPDIISNLTNMPDLPEERFKDIMCRLLRYITKDKQSDALVTRCAGRITADASLKAARGFIFCIQQLKVSLKTLSCLDERFAQLKFFLLDDEFWAAIKDIVKKARDSVKGRADAEQAVDAFVKRLEDARAEAQELERGPVPDQEASDALSNRKERTVAEQPAFGEGNVSNVKSDTWSIMAPGDAEGVANSPSDDADHDHVVSRRPGSIGEKGVGAEGGHCRGPSGHSAAATAGRLEVFNELRRLHEGKEACEREIGKDGLENVCSDSHATNAAA